jgi:hypothetical protein
MAAMVPIMVAITAELTPIRSVEYRELIMVRSWNSSTYQRRVNPPHTPLERASLKEYTMSTAMGRYRKANTK